LTFIFKGCELMMRLKCGFLLLLALMMGFISTVRADDGAAPVVILLFIFFGLIVGIVIMQILSKLGDPLPYTVVVFTTGLVFSLANKGNAGQY
jgi:xanthosine utilization system XapX-like protein